MAESPSSKALITLAMLGLAMDADGFQAPPAESDAADKNEGVSLAEQERMKSAMKKRERRALKRDRERQ